MGEEGRSIEETVEVPEDHERKTKESSEGPVGEEASEGEEKTEKKQTIWY